MRRPASFSRVGLRLTALLPGLLLGMAVAADNPVPGLPPGTVVLRGHTEPVYAVAFTPDGRNAVTGSFDKTLKVWAADTGREVRTFGGPSGHQGLVLAVSLSGDGQVLASGGADNTARVWDFPSSSPARQFPHGAGVLAGALSPDGKLLAGGGKDGVIKVWSTADGKATGELKGHQGAVNSLSWSGNGQMLVSGGADGTTRFWDVPKGLPLTAVGGSPGPVRAVLVNPNTVSAYSLGEDGVVRQFRLPSEPGRTLPAHAGAATALALSADGGQVLTGGADRTLRQAAFANAQPGRVYKGAGDSITVAALSPAGNLAAAGTAAGRMNLWGPQGETPTADLEAHAGGVTGLVFLGGGIQMLTAGKDGVLRLWTLPVQPDRSLPHPAAVGAVAAAPDGKKVLTGAADKVVRLWNPANPAAPERQFAGHTAAVTSLALGGQNLAAGGADGSIKVWNQASGQATASLDGHKGAVTGLAVSGSGQDVASGSADGTVKMWAAAPTPGKPAAPRWQTSAGGPVRGVLLSPRGDAVISGGEDGTVKLWALADGKAVRSVAAHAGPVAGLAASADGAKLVTAGADKAVKVWSLAGPGDKPLSVIALPGPAQSLALSPNGTRVAVGVGGEKGSAVRVYDLASGQLLQALPGHAEAVAGLAFAADNRTLFSGGAGRTARVADVAVQTATEAHPGGVTALAPLGGGSQVLSGGADGTVKAWEPYTLKLVRTFGPLGGPVTAAAASRDGVHVAAAAGKTLKVLAAADGKEVQTLEHPAALSSIAYDNDRNRLVSGCADGLARVWQTATGKVLQTVRPGGAVTGVAFHPYNGQFVAAGEEKSAVIAPVLGTAVIEAAGSIKALALANSGHLVTGGEAPGLTLWNPSTGAKERALPGGPAESLAFARNGVLAAAADKDGVIRLTTQADGKLVGQIKAAAPVRALAFQPNTSQVLVSASGDGTLRAWNVAYNQGQLPPADFGQPIQGYAAGPARDIAFAPDGVTFYTSGEDGQARAWRLAAATATRTFSHPREVDAVALNAAGTVLATGGHDGNVRLWDVAKGASLKEIKAHPPAPPPAPQNQTNPVYCLAWHPSATQVLSGGKDGSLKLWDAAAGTLVREFRAFKDKEFAGGHKDAVFCAAFSPDGKLLASGSGGSERAVKLWNATDGTVVRDLVNPGLKPGPGGVTAAHPGWVYGVRFTPDGKYLVSVGAAPRGQGYLAFWSVADGKLVLGQELPVGTLYSVAVSPDGRRLAVAAGVSGGKLQDVNRSYLLPLPGAEK